MASTIERSFDDEGNVIVKIVNESKAKRNEKKLYAINKDKTITIYRKGINTTPDYEIIFEGFEEIPKPFSEKSNNDDGTLYSLYSHAKKHGFNKLIISSTQENKNDNDKLIIAYSDYLQLLEKNKEYKNKVSTFRQRERSKFLKSVFPKIFSGLTTSFPSISEYLSKEIIDKEVLKRLNYEKLKSLFKISSEVVYEKFGKNIQDYQKEVTVIANIPAIKEAASKLEKLMNNKNKKEIDYNSFLIETFPLLRFDYVHIERELNVICGGTKKTDFFMINSEGFVDVFEIKTPKLKMLKYDKSHDNYHWSDEASKAIAQLEKYLHYVETNKLNIKDGISKKHSDLYLEIARPKGILIMGSDNELITANMKLDFRLLRSSLKNIEIITYSDLLRSLTNLVKCNKQSSNIQ